jgi:hypothetical protein
MNAPKAIATLKQSFDITMSDLVIFGSALMNAS